MERQSTPFHALIVGIDNYLAIDELRGAVADAEAMAAYLRDNLGVSESQITLLCDGQATRKALVEALEAIETNSSIVKDDPILIYFAGHGGEAAAPKGWYSTRSKVQLIKPYDYTPVVDGPAMNVLLDRSIAVLLDKIAQAKGDNITVCFDCCHSSSGTRRGDYLVRWTEESITLAEDVDQDILGDCPGDRAAIISLEKGLGSHVLLAACGEEEWAFEVDKRGMFTKALLEELQRVGADQITYTALIRRISALNGGKQNPHCEGRNRWRTCFNGKTPGRRNLTHPVRKTDEGYVMDAGTMHGITDGATFAVYDNAERTNLPLGLLIASKPLDFSTPMEPYPEYPPFDINDQAFALLQTPGQDEHLHIYIEEKEFRSKVTQLIEQMDTGVTVLQTESTANLGLTFDGHNIHFDILDGRVTTLGMTRIPFSISFDFNDQHSIENLKQVLLSAARYHWHLWRDSIVPKLQGKVNIMFQLLKEDDEMEEDTFPSGLRPCGLNLIQDGKVDLVVNEEADYGIKITNKSRHPMYPFVFCFSSDFSIVSYYEPGCAGGKSDVPLPPGESITIGYGSGGTPPIRFEFDSTEQNLDVAFFKIFLSTVPVDLSSIAQPAASDESHRKPTNQPRQKRSASSLQVWCTINIPIIQKRN